jgi:hypothetical protein
VLLADVTRFFAEFSMCVVEMVSWNLREQVMHKVIGVVSRKKDQAYGRGRKDISCCLEFIRSPYKASMVEAVSPKIQGWIHVKKWNDDKE